MRLAWTLTVLLAACASAPPPPDWQREAKASLQRYVEARLSGNDRVAVQEFGRARVELARTGRPDLMARAELLRCAVDVAALQFEPCAGFERLRADAAPAERAYAAYLAGKVTEEQRLLLPLAQQVLATKAHHADADLAALGATGDPLSRLLAAALWLRSGRSTPAVLALAVDTASMQGWRRPLLAWLGVQQRQAVQEGDAVEAARLGRRMDVVMQEQAAP